MKAFDRLGVAVLSALAAVLLGAAQGALLHGMTWDEYPQFQALVANVRLASAEDGPMPSAFVGQNEYYGLFSRLPVLAIWRAAEHLAGDPAAPWAFDRWAVLAFHLASLAFAVVALPATCLLAARMPGLGRAALLAPLLLLLYPRFAGHAFFNIKDVPFAAMATMFSAAAASVLVAPAEAARRRAVVAALLSAGFLASLKAPGAVATWPLVAAAVAAPWLPEQRRPAGLDRALLAASPLVAVAMAVALAPAAWDHPLDWLAGAFGLFGRYPWEGCTMTWGTCLEASSTPRDYLLRWFAATTPLAIAVLVMAGLAACLRAMAALLPGRQAADAAGQGAGLERFDAGATALVMVAQLGTFPFAAAILGASIYDGERHFLFVVPAACAVAAVGWKALHGRLSAAPRGRAAVHLALGAGLALAAVDSVRLHPYQYAYYNEVARLGDASSRFETDYWGFAIAELIRRETLRGGEPGRPGGPVYVSFPNTGFPFARYPAAAYRSRVKRTTRDGLEQPFFTEPTLVFAINRGDWRRPPADCRVLDVEQRSLTFAGEPLVMARTLACEAGVGIY